MLTCEEISIERRSRRLIAALAGGAAGAGVHALVSRDVGVALTMGATFFGAWVLTDVLMRRPARADAPVSSGPVRRLLATGWERAQRTGDPTPEVTLVLAMLFVVLAVLGVVPAVVTGSVGASIGLVAIGMLLALLPALFAPQHGRAAAVCRLAGIAVACAALAAVSAQLWG